MTIKFSRHIYQDPIIRTLELVGYECFINHTCVRSKDQFCAQICTRFYARLINECHWLLLLLRVFALPVPWKTSCVVPVQKSVHPKEPGHFCPVVLTSPLSSLSLPVYPWFIAVVYYALPVVLVKLSVNATASVMLTLKTQYRCFKKS